MASNPYSGIDLSGLSGFALEAAKAMKGGASYDQGISTATQKIGGSGLTVVEAEKVTRGGAASATVEVDDHGYVRAISDGTSRSTSASSKTRAQEIIYEPQLSREGLSKDTGGTIKSTNKTSYDDAYTPFKLPENPADITVSKAAAGNMSNYLVFGIIVLLVIKVLGRGQGGR